ncbi:MAG: dna replication licensing factor mcm5 [Olpidium bornovanus]|uniref:DNA replication licensing factor MCM5 n=1 Tax=Olpidium bornovanus TaxID=278681 RepID=A0A8H8DEJ0_9FUNG|nr:MAG: dna replication licensing factor mcm5 [Olpidium bornovanus]
MNVHMNKAVPEQAAGEIELDKMRGYISYCKMKCAPRLSSEAAEKLSSHFVSIRSEMRGMEMDMHERSTIPITLRQLEAIIRISESLAKITLSPVATEEHVDEAIRLFKYSTMDAVRSGQVDGATLGEIQGQVAQIENEIRRRLPVGSSISERRLTDDFVKQGFPPAVVSRAILIMVRQEVLQYRHQRNTIYRASI